MSCYAAGDLALIVVSVPLCVVAVLDVWRNVWQMPKNRPSVNTGKSPVSPTRSPR